MDLSTMTFEEILFHGHWHLIGAALFLVFFFVFVQEMIKEIRAARARRSQPVRKLAYGPMLEDHLLGQTMTDGGQPLEGKDSQQRDSD